MEKRVASRLLSQIKHGTLTVTFWDGDTQRFGNGKPEVHITIHDKKLLRAMLKNASLAIGEAYVDGTVEVDEPLTNMIILADSNRVTKEEVGLRDRFSGLNKNRKSKQAKFIQHHYDLGNEFYKMWLDPTMSYSCAYFHSPSDSLEQAQKQKTNHILRKLQLEPGMKLLDIGSGWGYLLVTAAKQYQVRGLGVTLSREQVAYAQALAKREGVDKLVEFKLLNYQDLPKSGGFDRVVSVGFFEHVGRGNLRDYFKQVAQQLKPGGISVLHSISHQVESPSDPWIDKYIFPGGYLPSVRETTALLPEYGFQLFDYENLGQHYAMTLERWWQAYEKHKAEVIKMYDERFYRMWRLYLVAAMMAFKGGSAHLSQWTFKKGSEPDWPLTREYLYK
jgi:cyclopropane-fatty-acyl-phospholipid synthase